MADDAITRGSIQGLGSPPDISFLNMWLIASLGMTGMTSKPIRQVTGGSVPFRPVSVVLNNDNRPEPDGTVDWVLKSSLIWMFAQTHSLLPMVTSSVFRCNPPQSSNCHFLLSWAFLVYNQGQKCRTI